MKTYPSALNLLKHLNLALAIVTVMSSSGAAIAQISSPPGSSHAAHSSAVTPASSPGDTALSLQITNLQAKVAQLESMMALHSQQPSAAGMNPTVPFGPMAGMSPGPAMGMPGMRNDSSPGMPAMPGMSEMGGSEMGMMGMMNPQMMAMMNSMMGMEAMGKMQMQSAHAAMPQSALPGFPGASHLYHIGATGFFLDHAEHIHLSTDQQVALNKIKQQALSTGSAAQRQIQQAEEELATLTSADQPDVGKIEAKIREIEKSRANERLTFIRAVGEAAKLLTNDQRKVLTGFAPPWPNAGMNMAPPAVPSATADQMPHM